MRCWAGEGEFRELLAADERLQAALDADELGRIFDPAHLLANVDAIYERVFDEC